jgi:hypothetical protein
MGSYLTSLVHISSGDFETYCILEVPEILKYIAENFGFQHLLSLAQNQVGQPGGESIKKEAGAK